ncbi:PqqD family protein [Zhihengliuella sp.]|uniref:PqqD family protein n=1 Tax=Zhihengliuella sp. TaxID=1954483 RepID=UPI0028114C5E|nr:PqqD family protein [Zhihengliuella sp.]
MAPSTSARPEDGASRTSAPVHYRRAGEVAEVRSPAEDRHALLPLFDMDGRPPRDAPQPLVLTGSASAIWEVLGRMPDEGATAATVARTTAAEFGVEPVEIESDVEQFLEQLADAGLAERLPARRHAVN